MPTDNGFTAFQQDVALNRLKDAAIKWFREGNEQTWDQAKNEILEAAWDYADLCCKEEGGSA